MRPLSRAYLARQLAAAIVEAACKGQGVLWGQCEAAHAAAATSAAAEVAAVAAMALCAGCPETLRCASRAEVDRYTGLAAGAAYVNGARKPTSAVVLNPAPPQRRAG